MSSEQKEFQNEVINDSDQQQQQQQDLPDHILAAKGKIKGCSDPLHTKNEPMFLCLRPKCEKCRLICTQCIMQNSHEHPDYWIDKKELMDISVKQTNKMITNWPHNKQLKSVFTNCISAEQGNPDLALTEQLLDDFKEKICKQVDDLKENIKEVITKQQVDQKSMYEYFKNTINHQLNLLPLQQYVKDYQECKMPLQELDEKIKQFSNNSLIKNKALLQEYQNQMADKKIKTINILGLNKKISRYLGEFSNVETAALQNTSSSNVEFDGKRSGTSTYSSKSVQNGAYQSLVSKTKFSSDMTYSFKFKLNEYAATYLYFGLVSKTLAKNQQYFWYQQGGPQLCLKTPNQRQSTFKVEGKDITSVFNPNQTYLVEFCVAENFFQISDEDQKSCMTFSDQFANKSEEYVIVMGPNQNIQFSIDVV